MGHYQPTVIKYIVADKSIEEGANLFSEFRRFLLQLSNRSVKAVCNLYILTKQIFYKLYVMIAGYGKRASVFHHFHHEPKHGHIFWATVAKIAQKDRFSACRVRPAFRFSVFITQLLQQSNQFVITAVYVADDIKWPMLIFFVVPHLCADDLSLVDFFLGI